MSGRSVSALVALTFGLLLSGSLPSLATLATLYPTAWDDTNAGADVPTGANALADDGSGALVSSSNTTLILSGFDNTDLGTINSVTVYVEYLTTAAPNNDTYQFDAARDGASFTDSIVAANTTHQASYTVQSLSLGALTWAQVGTLAVRCLTAKAQSADGYDVDWDVGYIVVDYSPALSVTIGDGASEPAGSSNLCPETPSTALDTFTLTADTSATLSSVEVTLDAPADSWQGVSSIEIRTDAGALLGSATPGSNTVNVTGLSIPVTTATDIYRVWMVPETATGMPAVPGSVISVSGTVSSVGPAAVTDNDSTSATHTIDNASPNNPTAFTGVTGDTEVTLSWSNPVSDFAEVVVLRRPTLAVADTPTEGVDYSGQVGTIPGGWTATVAYVGTAQGLTDIGLTNGVDYYYEIFAKDFCGNYSAGGAVTGPHQPKSLAGLVVVSNSAVESACKQITVTAAFSADIDGDSFTRVYWDTTAGGTGNIACATLTSASPRQCLVTGFPQGVNVYVRVDHTDPDGVDGAGVGDPWDSAAFNTTCGADQAAPTLLFLNPSRGSVIGGTERVKLQVFDEGGLAVTDPVQWSVDGGAVSPTSVAVNANYSCDPTSCTNCCWVYEFDVNTTTAGTNPLSLANGDHYLLAQATDLAGNTSSLAQPVAVNNDGLNPAGDGFILRRSHGSALCIDCHNIATHSSQSSSTKYGNWAIECTTCHTPHRTRNIFLIREQIETPNSGLQPSPGSLDFRVTTQPVSSAVAADRSYLGDTGGDANTGPYTDGVCEVCHTKTTIHRNDGSQDVTHNVTNASLSCTDCHAHGKGFAGPSCNGCHKAPPSVGAHGAHDEVWDNAASIPTAYDTTTSHATTTQYGFPCAKCHSGTHINDSAVNPTHDGTLANPWQVEVTFDTSTPPSNPSGSFAGTYNQNTDSGASGEYWSWSNGSCSTAYCHSDAKRSLPNYVTPSWTGTNPSGCAWCHQLGGSTTLLSDAHAKHTDDTAVTGYQFGCVRCHASTVSSGVQDIAPITVSDKSNHVDGTRTLSFDASGPDNSLGSYSDSPGFTCSNTYCHSTGQDRTAPYTSPASIA